MSNNEHYSKLVNMADKHNYVNIVYGGVTYLMCMWGIGAKFLCSKLPLYKKY